MGGRGATRFLAAATLGAALAQLLPKSFAVRGAPGSWGCVCCRQGSRSVLTWDPTQDRRLPSNRPCAGARSVGRRGPRAAAVPTLNVPLPTVAFTWPPVEGRGRLLCTPVWPVPRMPLLHPDFRSRCLKHILKYYKLITASVLVLCVGD